MSSFICPACKLHSVLQPRDYEGTIQCTCCPAVLKIKIKNDIVSEIAVSKIDVPIPDGLQPTLKRILVEAVKCFDCGSDVASLVLCRLFIEGLLTEIGIKPDKLWKMIETAYDGNAISQATYYTATLSRLKGNESAHYSEELGAISSDDSEMVLKLVSRIAAEVVQSGRLATAKKANS